MANDRTTKPRPPEDDLPIEHHASGLEDDEKVAAVNDEHRCRFPFVILVDVSKSTGFGDDPDINHINASLQILIEKLRYPPPTSALADHIKAVDVTILAYSDTVAPVLAWTNAKTGFPPSLRTLTPDASTFTGRALKEAFRTIGDKLRIYRNKELQFGMPHIFHLTDGAPKDLLPGTPLWEEITARLAKMEGGDEGEDKIGILIHLVTPRGTTDNVRLLDNSKITGTELMGRLSGKKSVIEATLGVEAFETLMHFVVALIGNISSGIYGSTVDAAKESIKGSDKLKPLADDENEFTS